MNLALWAVQILQASLYGWAGFEKAFHYGHVVEMWHWPARVPQALVTFIGIAEMLGAIGLILPWLTGIQRWLTPLAAAALVTLMTLASIAHILWGEAPHVAFTGTMLALNLFITLGRRAALGSGFSKKESASLLPTRRGR